MANKSHAVRECQIDRVGEDRRDRTEKRQVVMKSNNQLETTTYTPVFRAEPGR